MEDKELKIKVSRVLAAAEKCPDWKEGLREMFPDAFESEPIKLVRNGEICEGEKEKFIVWVWGNEIYLHTDYNWKMLEETIDHCVKLIPTRKS